MAAAARKKNWFAIWITIAVVVVVAVVAGVVIVMNNAATSSKTIQLGNETPTSSNIDSTTGAISFGTAKNTMATYIDLMCPICQQFEEAYGTDIQSLVKNNTATLQIHPISILDESSQGTKYSTRAASDVYAVAVRDYANTQAFITALYDNQPKEQSTGLTDQQLIALAKKAGVNMTSELQNDFTTHPYGNYVTKMTPKTPLSPGATGIGTPTIAINGTTISLSTLPQPGQLATLFK
jgi:protein-disulfide isomerase